VKKLILTIFAIAAISFPLLSASSCSAKSSSGGYASGAAATAPQYDIAEGSASYESGYLNGVSAEVEMPVMPQESKAYAEESSLSTPVEQKIIKSGDVNLDTEDFDNDMQAIKSLAEESGGYLQSSSLSGGGEGSLRHFQGVLRVPSGKFEAVKASLEQVGYLTYSSERSENATSEYYDTQGRLEIKRVEKERTILMREEATLIEDILYLEQRLGEINTDIEVMEARLENIDALASYSTINVYLNEVSQVAIRVTDGESLIKRLQQSFVGSATSTGRFLQDAAVVLASASIPIFLILILLAVGLAVSRSLKKKAAQQ
jgi:hypothetical protein